MNRKLLVIALTAMATAPLAGAAEKVDFLLDVKPILEAACVSCHGPEKPKAALRLDSLAAALKGGDDGPALAPGKSKESTLYTTTVLPPDHDDVMPPKEQLTRAQTEVLRRWIDDGASWPADLVLKQSQRINFAKDIQPILEFNCVACHREGEDKGGLRLDNKADAFKGGDNGPGIIPHRPKNSPVYTSTTLSPDDDALMPPAKKGGPMPKDKIELLKLWIEQGAVWPDDLKLVPKKPEEVPGADENLVVAEIHKLIMSRPQVKTEGEMKVYTNGIPGTHAIYAMAPIASGENVMGSPETEPGRKRDETPQHRVKLSPFWMGQFEVTWNEFELFMFPDEERKYKTTLKTDPYVDKVSDAVSRPTKPYVEMSFGMGKDGYPAISMTHHAANKYCQWLSSKTGHFYRLPTEAEWEYACRAGTTTAFSFGDDVSKLADYGWYEKNGDFKYQKVGRKKPNPWGLFDMHGNVAEWCLDQYEEGYKPPTGAVMDPWLRATRPYPHVVRGGSWNDPPEMLRSAARQGSDRSWKQQDPQLPKSIWYHTDAQFLGFRVVRPLKVPSAEEMFRYWNSGVEKEH